MLRLAGGDGEPLSVMDQLERIARQQLVADTLGVYVHAQPSAAIDEAEAQGVEPRGQARGEFERLPVVPHAAEPRRRRQAAFDQ